MTKLNNLIMRLQNTTNPFLEEQKGSQYDLWGKLLLEYESEVLFYCEWELHNWIKNFIEKKEILLTQKFPFHYINSIKESCDFLRMEIIGENDDIELSEESENKLEAIFDYISDHYFEVMGTDTQRFYIGLNPDGLGEISYYKEDEAQYRKYEFDMRSFVEEADQEIVKYLKKIQFTLSKDEIYFKQFLGAEYSKYIQKVVE